MKTCVDKIVSLALTRYVSLITYSKPPSVYASRSQQILGYYNAGATVTRGTSSWCSLVLTQQYCTGDFCFLCECRKRRVDIQDATTTGCIRDSPVPSAPYLVGFELRESSVIRNKIRLSSLGMDYLAFTPKKTRNLFYCTQL